MLLHSKTKRKGDNVFKYPVLDSHIHLYQPDSLADIEEIARLGGYEQYTLLSCSILPQFLGGNLVVAWAKQKHPEQVYGYAVPHMRSSGPYDGQELLEQVKLFHRCGFDGIKMLDGKPTLRKLRGIPLDSPVYDPMFDYLEEMGIPVLYHSNDPVEFWDEKKIPAWAREVGFFYEDTYPSQRQITEETIGILKKHPALHLTLAHFFFLSNTDDYDLAAELLDTYPNLMFDLTPGWEMFEGFARNRDIWKQFFEKYSNRLLYGTDIGGKGGERILEPLRRCLETDEIVDMQGTICPGLSLSDEILKKIYRDNYRSFVQKENPRRMDMEALWEYKRELMHYYEQIPDFTAEAAEKQIEEFWKLLEDIQPK